ncbi:MAG: M12 family metallo-peptidase [Leadbetterella sp.]
MKKLLLIQLSLFLFINVNAQNTPRIAQINVIEIRNTLKVAPTETSKAIAKQQAMDVGISIMLPLPDGTSKSFVVIESPLMEPELAKQYSEIKTYRVYGKDADGLITVAPSGVYGLIFDATGNVVIAPKNILHNEHEVLYQNDLLGNEECTVGGEHTGSSRKNNRDAAVQTYSNGFTLRTYRMAIVTTGEFYVNNNGTTTDSSTVQAAIVSLVNSLKAVYEKEASVSFNLVATKFYKNAATDPFDGSNALKAAEVFGGLITSDPTNFALTNYDIGHVLHGASGGGVAYLNTPCRNGNLSSSYTSPQKAGAWSGSTTTSFTTFIHEVGHQFSAGHTFNSISSSCNGNIMTGSAYEPGSGSTYMSYAGNCSPDNTSGGNSRSYFNTNSLESIINFSVNSATCSVNTSTGNSPPVINANPNAKTLIIPKNTPFLLEGSGIDANGHTILYNWEQANLGTTRGAADDARNSTDSPIFRSVSPTTTGNVRSFPNIAAIRNGNLPNNDEALPQVARTITMKLTGRDNNASGGGMHNPSIDITVTDSEPFKVSSFNNPTTWVYDGTSSVLLTWDVSQTNQTPINCINVKVTFSTDNGNTFPITLLTSTPNDGSQLIQIPNNITTTGRIKIEGIGNIFFDINDRPITITNACVKETVSTISPNRAVAETVGSSALNLTNSSPLFGLANTITESLGTNDPTTTAVAKNPTTSVCIPLPAITSQYDRYAIRVSVAGAYTFTFTGGTLSSNNRIMNLYQNNYDVLNLCTNWLASNITSSNGTSYTLANPMAISLVPNVTYILVVSGNNNSTGTYTLGITNTIGGEVRYAEPQKTAFKYLTVNNSNNAIVDFSDSTNYRSYPVGSYKVYVFSYTQNLVLSSYVNTDFTVFQNNIVNNTICGVISSNFRQIDINPDCPSTTDLTGIATLGITQAIQSITSNQTINSTINTTYKASNFIMLLPEFNASSGSIFKAEIGGCN